eukprot:GFYU01003935.1.p1 GENE.GFYU01003935.1~~GFYU01003935.1.p1  ORF type:complete len:418 (-),score=117.24 GFYU01003935.1:6-1091(-)
MADELTELVEFIDHAKCEVRNVAVHQVAGFTVTDEGCAALRERDAVKFLVKRIGDLPSIVTDAVSALINMCADRQAALQMGEMKIYGRLVEALRNPKDTNRELYIQLIVNMTRFQENVTDFIQWDDDASRGFYLTKVIELFCDDSLIKGDEDPFKHVATLLMNVTQTSEGRDLMLARHRNFLANIKKYIAAKDDVRRLGTVGTFRNCCFEVEQVPYVFELGVVSLLAPPLVHPEAKFDDEDKEGMLPEILKRESPMEANPDVMQMMLETLRLLAVKKVNRIKMKAMKLYPVMRELDPRIEDQDEVTNAIVELVSLLVREEEGEKKVGGAEASVGTEPKIEELTLDDDEKEDAEPAPESLVD